MLRKYLSLAAATISIVSASALFAQTALPPAAPTAAPAAAVTAKPGAADYGRLPFIAKPRISPDGLSLAGLINIQGEQVIAMRSLFKSDEKPVYVRTPEGTQVTWLRWVGDNNLLVGLYALRPVEGERWPILRMVGIDRTTGKITTIMWDRLGQNAADVLWTATDGTPNILMAAQNSVYIGEDFWPEVWRVNIATGKRSSVLKGRTDVMDWFADSDGNIRTGVSYDDDHRKFKLFYRDPGAGSFKAVDTADARQQEALTQPFLFIPGTTHAMTLQDNDQGLTAIYETDLLTQQNVRTVYSAPAGSEVDNVWIARDGKTLLGASYSGATSGTMWLDPALAEVQSAIDKSVPDRRVRIVSMSDDRTRLLIIIDRADTPGALYYFDITSGKMQRIAVQNDKLGTKPLNPAKLIRYKARDGLEIEAVLTLPRDRPAKALPIVMLPHGGPWAQDTLDYDYWAQFIASRGYAVLQPNFRGSTGYGTPFMRKGEGQLGLAMQDDISDGLAWAAKEGIADPKRACIVGASYGGYAAMWGIAKDPDLYRCAVSIAGVANLRREVNDFGSAIMGGKYRDDWKRMTPDFATVSPINAISRIKAPLLLIHGKKDITVDYVQSESMFNKMRGAGKTVELVPMPLADHHFTREADRILLLSSIETFLARHNPADPPPAK
ncbi:S9 family peptidase [Novosphingobium sp.]|uniref:alpha/beta hydrolase family protein n=1 Tax=Novosphingobium sp. TaxID=1874826 RepID=UPI0025E96110|nr:S9 family peptidase [Novosphingobium sp.]MCC6925416.1 S9 family peptidase [Novosphingobium sp.]